MPRTFYRILRGPRPRREDFLSAQARSLPPRLIQRRIPELYSGISVYDTLGLAQATAQAYPKLGRYVAEVLIPDDADVEVHKTLGPGHYTLVDAPDLLVSLVVDVRPIDE